MDFTIFGSCLILKNGAIFVHFSTLISAIYRVFIYVLDGNIASVVLFQNLLSEHGAIATGFSLISQNTENFGKKPMCSDVRNR